MATGLSNTGFSAIQGVTPMWPPVAWPEQTFGLSAIYGGGAANIISLLGGALYLPDTNTCWQDAAGTVPGAYDKKVALMNDVTGLFTASQPTTNYQPYLRSANYSDLPFTSATGEEWTPARTLIDDAGGIEWENGEAYWRNSAGTGGNYASTPDSAAASITGDLTLIVKAELADWTPAATNGLVSKFSGTTGEYRIYISTGGLLIIGWYSGGVSCTASSTTAVGGTDASALWLKAIRVIGVKCQFYKSTDYNQDTGVGTWVQIGTDVVNTDPAPADTVNPLILGQTTSTISPIAGKIHYAAAWANITGEGTPAWEFRPTRDAVKPASPWLDFDGTDDYLISSIIPGNYSEGFICAGAVQTEAIGGINGIFGSSNSDVVRGVRFLVNAVGKIEMTRTSGSAGAYPASPSNIAKNIPFFATVSYWVAGAKVGVNGESPTVNAITRDYTGSTQYALIGASNNTESGVAPTIYLQGHIHALVWLPVTPTEAQETAIRNYVASKTGVTL